MTCTCFDPLIVATDGGDVCWNCDEWVDEK